MVLVITGVMHLRGLAFAAWVLQAAAVVVAGEDAATAPRPIER